MIPNNASNLGPTAQTADEDEDRINIHGNPPAVTRISRRAVLLVAVFGASLGLVVLMLGFGDHTAPRKEGSAEENSIRPSGPIESVKNLPQDYSFDVNRLGASYDGLSRPTAASGTTRPSGQSAQDQALIQAMRDLAQQREKLLDQQQKEQQTAFDSPLLFGGTKLIASSAVSTGRMPASMPTIMMLGSDHSAALGAGSAEPGGASRSQNRQSDKEAFLTQAAAVDPYLSKPLLNPISKYELKAGSVISGALLTAINSDLPGEVIGQVTENVYDSATGNYLLIPQGAKLLGKYQSLVSNGQNRALMVWQRLIYPNGNSIVLDGMPGTDETGASGLADKVDYHLDKLVEATALTTALAYAGNLARNPNSSSGNNGNDVVGDTVAQQANRIGEKIIDRELDVQPTITIRQGWPLRVLVNKDMIFR
jgi:type IV secretion system protein VirB10